MKQTHIFSAVLAALATLTARGDVLELKNGQILSGRYTGGTAGTVRFETASGQQVIETVSALALTFTGEPVPAAPPAAPATPPPAAPIAAVPTTVTVNAGTAFLVRMVDGASSRSPRGARFAAVLELDLIANGVVVAKAGTRVYGRVADAQQAGRYVGRSVLDLRMTDLTVGGVLAPIVTGPYIEAGKSSLAKTARTTAAGAAIGAIAGDAGKGAAIGAVASGAKRGQTVGVGPGELMEFQLQQPLTVSIPQ